MTDFAAKYHSDGKVGRCSFRGASFWWLRGGDGGLDRQTVNHEYPQRENNHVQDLGKKTGEHNLVGFVLGKDFITEAQKLIEACGEPGPGLLMHPLLGRLRVVCTGCRPDYSTGRTGYVEFDLAFQEEGKNQYPSADDDYAKIAADKALASAEAAKADAIKRLDLGGPGWLATALKQDVEVALGMVDSVIRIIANPEQAKSILLETVSGLVGQIRKSDAVGAAQAADIMDTAITGVGALASGNPDPLAAIKVALEISKYGLDSSKAGIYGGALLAVVESTATRRVQASNRKAIVNLVRHLAMTEAVRAAMNAKYKSRQAAESTRDLVVDRLDACAIDAADAGDDADFLALRGLLADTMDGFDSIIAAHRPAKQVQVAPAAMPSLVLAYDMYADLSMEQDILDRNPAIVHPGILPGGRTLEVLDA